MLSARGPKLEELTLALHGGGCLQANDQQFASADADGSRNAFKRVSHMTITKERKQELISEHQKKAGDNGSPEVQIAILTERINGLTDHMRTHRSDYASRRGLLGLVSRRRRLLDYVRRHDPQHYLDIIGRLGIRK